MQMSSRATYWGVESNRGSSSSSEPNIRTSASLINSLTGSDNPSNYTNGASVDGFRSLVSNEIRSNTPRTGYLGTSTRDVRDYGSIVGSAIRSDTANLEADNRHVDGFSSKVDDAIKSNTARLPDIGTSNKQAHRRVLTEPRRSVTHVTANVNSPSLGVSGAEYARFNSDGGTTYVPAETSYNRNDSISCQVFVFGIVFLWLLILYMRK